MYRFLIVLLTTVFWVSPLVFAQQTSGGGGEDLKGVCELSGGTFTGSEGGNWACCWDNWGCYGCVDGNCKMKCHTNRCRRANAVSRTGSADLTPVKGLAPAGKKPPIAPLKQKKYANAKPIETGAAFFNAKSAALYILNIIC